MKGKLRLQRALKSALDRKEDVTDTIPGLLGTIKNGKQRVKVTNRKGFVYVRLHGNLSETVQAYNDQVLQLYDMPVLVKRVHGKGYHYYVIGKDTGRYANWGGNNAQAQYAQHGNQHSFGIGAGGSDVVWVFKKQFMPLLLYPYSGTSVRVAEDWYQWGDIYKHFTGSVIDIGTAKPAMIGDSRFVTLYLDGTTNTVKGTTGTLFNSTPFPADVSPYINVPTPSEGIPLSAVLLTADTVNIAWNNIYDDIRPIFGVGGGDTAIYVSGTVSNLTSQYIFYLTSDALAVAPIPTGSTYPTQEMVVLDLEAEEGLEVSTYMNTTTYEFTYSTTFWSFVDVNKSCGYVPAGVWGASIIMDGNRETEDDLPWLEFKVYLYKQSSTGVETLISSSNAIEEKPGKARYDFAGTIANNVIIESTSRLLIRIRAKNVFSGVDTRLSHVWLYVNGEANSIIILPIAPSHGGGHIFADEGVNLTQRGYANFVGGGVTVTDDPTNEQTVITIPGTITYEDGIFRASGTTLSFDSGLHVDVTGSIAYIQSVDTSLHDLMTYERFVIGAHRGDINPTDGYPENTLAGMISAAQKGAQLVEMDVARSSDGVWYLMHDTTVDRTTNGSGAINSKTSAQIDALWIDGGYGYSASRHSGTYHPPSLSSVITALTQFDVVVQFDNKDSDAGSYESLANYIIGVGWKHRIIIGCATQANAQTVKAASPVIWVSGETAWSESDSSSATTGTYTAAQILAFAPKQIHVYDNLLNYNITNQAELTHNAWDLRARGYGTWDLNASMYEHHKCTILNEHINDANAHSGSSSGGGGSSITIYEGGAQKATGTTGIDFHNGFGVIVSGTIAFITNSIVSGTSTYVRAGTPIALTAITGAYWAVPDHVYATGTLALFINGVAQSTVIDFTEQYAGSGTYKLESVHPTGTIFTAIWGVPVINTLNSPPYDARFVMGAANAGVPNGVLKNYLYDNYDRDAYPTSPTSWDDDFNSTSINAKWTQINNPAGANAFSTSLYPGYLYVGLIEETGAGLGIFQAYPRVCQVAPTGVDATGTFSFIAKVSLALDGEANEAGEWCGIHLYLGSSGTFGFVAADIQANDALSVNQSYRVEGSRMGTTGSITGMTTAQVQYIDPTEFIYLKLSKMTSGAYTAANTYTAFFSKNGIIWQEVSSHSYTFSAQPNEVGLFFRRPKPQTGTPNGYALVDFFRKV